jgi:hypothetical protein
VNFSFTELRISESSVHMLLAFAISFCTFLFASSFFCVASFAYSSANFCKSTSSESYALFLSCLLFLSTSSFFTHQSTGCTIMLGRLSVVGFQFKSL